MAFDVAGARSAGYSDQEIADYLAGGNNFDVAGARNSGYTDLEIIQHLQPQQQAQPIESQIPTGIAGVTEVKFSQAPAYQEPTLGQKALGAGEAALSAVTGATTGALGYLGGAAKGIGQELIGGVTGQGPQPGSGYAEQQAMQGSQALTYAPKTQAGQEYTQAVGSVARQLAPIAPLTAEVGALGSAFPYVKAKATSQVTDFIKFHRLGLKIPPAAGKGTAGQQMMEGIAGPVPTKQAASLANQPVINNLIKQDLNYPQDVPLSIEGLNAIRSQAGQAYEAAKGFGAIPVDKKFKIAIGQIGKSGSSFAKEFPGLVKKDVNDLLRNFRGNSFSAESLVEVAKQMRADSNAGYNSMDPAIKAMARAKGQIATAVDNLIERAASEKAPQLVSDLKNARQTIAKTYQVQGALKGENVDAVALGRALDKGKPMSGLMRDVAEFGQKFKGAAQVTPPQQTNFRPMDVLTGIGSAAATGDVAWLAAAGIRPVLRKLILSKPYQGLVAKMTPSEWEAVINLPSSKQVQAMQYLLAESNAQQGLAQQ